MKDEDGKNLNGSGKHCKVRKENVNVVFGSFIAKDPAPAVFCALSFGFCLLPKAEKVFQIIINSVRNFRGLKEWKFLQIRMNRTTTKAIYQKEDK